MGLRQREWAARKRQEILQLLGRRCRWCGSRRHLEFDCIVAQGHRHHAMGSAWRMSFYLLQLERENLQVLCRRCNAVKGG